MSEDSVTVAAPEPVPDAIQKKGDRTEYFRMWHLKNRERRSAARHERYMANKEKYNEATKQWAKQNPEKIKAAQLRYRTAHLEEVRKRSRESNKKNYPKRRDSFNARRRARYPQNRELVAIRNRKYADENREKIRAKQKEYRLKNLELKREQCREWHRAHRNDPDYKRRQAEQYRRDYQRDKISFAFRAAKRRALKKGAAVNLAAIKEWIRSVKSQKTVICYFCQKPTPSKGMHLDHIVPLSKGGEHSVRNLCVSCPSCNLSKGAKPIQAWVRIGQQILAL